MSEYTNPVHPFLFDLVPVDLSGRGLLNPARYRMAPAMFGGEVHDGETVQFINGKPYIGNTPLGDIGAQTGPANPQAIAPIDVKDSSKYGDSVIIALVFAGAGFSTLGSVVLARPNNYRSALLIANQTVPGPIFYNYDQDADNVSSMQIAQNGSRNYDGQTVPQGNLSIFSSGAGTVILEFMNVNL